VNRGKGEKRGGTVPVPLSRKQRKGTGHLSTLTNLNFILFIFLPFLFISIPVSADNDSLKLRGYAKPLYSVTDFEGLGIEYTGSKDVEKSRLESSFAVTLRASLFWKPDASFSSEIAYELTPVFRKSGIEQSVFAVRAADPLSYRAADLGERVYSGSDGTDFQLFQNLDRAFISYSPDYVDAYIGRQPIAFGSARVVNPTDVLTSFTSVELNKEERFGVDAIRMRLPVGTLSEIDMGAVSGDNFSAEESAAFLRGRFSVSETDISPLVIVFKQNLLTGFDAAGSIRNAGYWFEGAYVFANMLDDHKTGQDYLRVSTGIDYSISEDLYAYIEYHFNGAGTGNPDKYSDIIFGVENDIAYSEGTVYLYGKHYIAPGFSYAITPLLSSTGLAIFNIRDNSILLSPGLQYSLSDNTSLDAGAFIGIGKGNDLARNSDTNTMTVSTSSEFSLYADTFFVSLRTYF